MTSANMIEESVRTILSKEYGVALTKRRLTLQRKKHDGSAKRHEFDLVSPDQRIVGEVKSYKYTRKAQANTRFPRMMLDCWYLTLVKADIKLMILTDETFYKEFQKNSNGLLPPSIKIFHCPVPHPH